MMFLQKEPQEGSTGGPIYGWMRANNLQLNPWADLLRFEGLPPFPTNPKCGDCTETAPTVLALPASICRPCQGYLALPLF
jgi:hypothetical protein